MTDMTTLVSGLSNYERQLQQHSLRVSESFQELTRALDRLHHAWEGTSANEFKAHFARTKEVLEQYLEGTKTIRHLLNERIDRLAEADRPEILESRGGSAATPRLSQRLAPDLTRHASPIGDDDCQKSRKRHAIAYKRMLEASGELSDAKFEVWQAEIDLWHAEHDLEWARHSAEKLMTANARAVAFFTQRHDNKKLEPEMSSLKESLVHGALALGTAWFGLWSSDRIGEHLARLSQTVESLRANLERARREVPRARIKYRLLKRRAKAAEWSVRQNCGGGVQGGS